jgi:hypothetical protein
MLSGRGRGVNLPSEGPRSADIYSQPNKRLRHAAHQTLAPVYNFKLAMYIYTQWRSCRKLTPRATS